MAEVRIVTNEQMIEEIKSILEGEHMTFERFVSEGEQIRLPMRSTGTYGSTIASGSETGSTTHDTVVTSSSLRILRESTQQSCCGSARDRSAVRGRRGEQR